MNSDECKSETDDSSCSSGGFDLNENIEEIKKDSSFDTPYHCDEYSSWEMFLQAITGRWDEAKFNHYRKSDFETETKLEDIFETLYYFRPQKKEMIKSLKKLLAKKRSEEIETPTLSDKDRSIILDRFVPPTTTLQDIFRILLPQEVIPVFEPMKEIFDEPKFRRYLFHKVGPGSTLEDIFETLYVGEDTLCSSMKKVLSKKRAEEIKNPTLGEKERSILLNEFVPPTITLIDILQILLPEDLIDVFNPALYLKLQRLKFTVNCVID